jgi:hypothetical protein
MLMSNAIAICAISYFGWHHDVHRRRCRNLQYRKANSPVQRGIPHIHTSQAWLGLLTEPSGSIPGPQDSAPLDAYLSSVSQTSGSSGAARGRSAQPSIASLRQTPNLPRSFVPDSLACTNAPLQALSLSLGAWDHTPRTRYLVADRVGCAPAISEYSPA